jgi:hypothetical protein
MDKKADKIVDKKTRLHQPAQIRAPGSSSSFIEGHLRPPHPIT